MNFFSYRKYEMSQLRLAAGASMLKICEQKGVGDQFTAEQFINLSRLMNVSSFLLFVLYCAYSHL